MRASGHFSPYCRDHRRRQRIRICGRTRRTCATSPQSLRTLLRSASSVFKIPWPGDRRVNIQNRNSQAKAHQQRQVSCRYEQEGGDVMETIQGPDVSRYTYRVTWSVEDGEFVATCAEFPSLSWLADSQAAALQGLVDVVADAVADFVSQGEAVPE